MTGKRPRFFGTIFQHSLALAVGSAFAVALASAFLVLTTSGPFYFPLSTFEIARLVEGRPLGRKEASVVMSTSPQRPPRATANGDSAAYSDLLGNALARNLGLPREDVDFVLIEPTRMLDPAVRAARAEYVDIARDGSSMYTDDNRFAPLVFGAFRADVRRADGSWVTVSSAGNTPGPKWQYAVTRWIGFALLLLLPIAWLFSNRLAQPIRSFAAAADRIGHGAFERISETGPAEIRTAAAALNEMQARLEGYVKERTAVIGAIAHDLRTPLARLAFLLRDAPASFKSKSDAEVAGMERLIAVAIDYVHSETATPQRDLIDLRLVAESVVEGYADMGEEAALAPGPSPLVAGDSVLLTRLIRNLVANALFYGKRARVALSVSGADVVVDVDDDGPGIPVAELERVFEPFYRGETSRNEATGGIGLGLAIVRSLARAHGGAVRLVNRAEGGLRARLTLPLAS